RGAAAGLRRPLADGRRRVDRLPAAQHRPEPAADTAPGLRRRRVGDARHRGRVLRRHRDVAVALRTSHLVDLGAGPPGAGDGRLRRRAVGEPRPRPPRLAAPRHFGMSNRPPGPIRYTATLRNVSGVFGSQTSGGPGVRRKYTKGVGCVGVLNTSALPSDGSTWSAVSRSAAIALASAVHPSFTRRARNATVRPMRSLSWRCWSVMSPPILGSVRKS